MSHLADEPVQEVRATTTPVFTDRLAAIVYRAAVRPKVKAVSQ